MARYLLQIIVGGTKIFGKSLVRAVQDEIAMSQEAARYLKQDREITKGMNKSKMNLSEAQQILNVKDVKDYKKIAEQFKFLLEANSDQKGGNLYLRSKIYYAKKRVEEEIKHK